MAGLTGTLFQQSLVEAPAGGVPLFHFWATIALIIFLQVETPHLGVVHAGFRRVEWPDASCIVLLLVDWQELVRANLLSLAVRPGFVLVIPGGPVIPGAIADALRRMQRKERQDHRAQAAHPN
eukprot:CAMPEP_0171143122 /NCGR_PEP_ID=MMETSP0766_2-20121228/143780_1 /TAXON_ID=439317 /ORGANISM="Gambierdiscus australes, Strain CAWD 149" /LENGTH=122 /DNA_ID=CAMNT_0011606939 /DNA_START=24 /DNA_END=393 /DNA_ORIENTATION=+